MTPIVALQIDDTIVNWLVGITAIVAPTIVYLFRQFIAFIKPLFLDFAHENTSLVREMRDHVPLVHATMAKMAGTLDTLSTTQKSQCETLARHEELHVQTKLQLGEILTKIHGEL